MKAYTISCKDCDTVCEVRPTDASEPEWCPICGSDDVEVQEQ